jgi:Mg-chelatase subunit ChlD
MGSVILRDFTGAPRRAYRVVREIVSTAPTAVVRTVAHIVLILDCSGSMYSELEQVKTMTEKVMTLAEFKDPDTLVSVISYSGVSDVITHVARSRVEDANSASSPAVKALRSLRTRGLTCISQGLDSALKLIQDGENTAIVLQTDGYANDASPGAERRAIDALIEKINLKPNVFMNTVAYAGWSDYKLLAYMANACSGTCFQAPTAKELFTAIESTVKSIAGKNVPAIALPAQGAESVVYVNGGKVIGASGDLTVRGDEGGGVAYRFFPVDVAAAGEDDVEATYAYANFALAEGRINDAKFAAVSTRNSALLEDHARALTGEQIAAFSTALNAAMLTPNTGALTPSYGLPNADRASVLAVLSKLSEYEGIELDLSSLLADYKRRGVRRIPGVRNADGTVTPPDHKLVARAGAPVKVLDFSLSREAATCNMRVAQAADLVRASDGVIVSEVAGVRLNLSRFNNYTLIGDGSVNVTSLRLKLGSKRLFADLQKMGAVAATASYDPAAFVDVDLTARPVVSYTASFDPSKLNGLMETKARVATLVGILNASLKGTSDDLTDEQIAALKAVGVSSSLYFNAPTTTEYADKAAALADGSLDSRVGYRVMIGTKDMLSATDLYSANEYLARRFDLSKMAGKKPTFMDVREGAVATVKNLTARTKLNACDDIQYPIVEDFLGVKTNGAVAGILTAAGLSAEEISAFYAAAHRKVGKDQAVSTMADTLKTLQRYASTLHEVTTDLVAYIGATGMIPESFGTLKPMDAATAKTALPNLSIGKALEDATFYVAGNTVICVNPEVVYFSTRGFGKADATATEE